MHAQVLRRCKMGRVPPSLKPGERAALGFEMVDGTRLMGPPALMGHPVRAPANRASRMAVKEIENKRTMGWHRGVQG